MSRNRSVSSNSICRNRSISSNSMSRNRSVSSNSICRISVRVLVVTASVELVLEC